MEKVSIEIESKVGVDIHSKSLSNSIFNYLFYTKKHSISIGDITLRDLKNLGFKAKEKYSINEFEIEKEIIFKILLDYKFVNRIYKKNHLILNYWNALSFFTSFIKGSHIFLHEKINIFIFIKNFNLFFIILVIGIYDIT